MHGPRSADWCASRFEGGVSPRRRPRQERIGRWVASRTAIPTSVCEADRQRPRTSGRVRLKPRSAFRAANIANQQGGRISSFGRAISPTTGNDEPAPRSVAPERPPVGGRRMVLAARCSQAGDRRPARNLLRADVGGRANRGHARALRPNARRIRIQREDQSQPCQRADFQRRPAARFPQRLTNDLPTRADCDPDRDLALPDRANQREIRC